MELFAEHAQNLIEKNNINTSEAFAPIKTQAYVVALQASGDFAKKILPEGMAMVSAVSDIDDTVERVITDEAFVLANLRALGLYSLSVIKGEKPDAGVDFTEGFYETFKNASDEQKDIAKISVFRTIASAFNAEIAKSHPDPLFEANANKDFENLVASIDVANLVSLYTACEEDVGFLLTLAQTYDKVYASGGDVKMAHTTNRLLYSANDRNLESVITPLCGTLLRKKFQKLLPKEEFEVLEALGEADEEARYH